MNKELKQIDTTKLVEIAFFLEGWLAAKGNVLPLGTVHIEELWKVAKEIQRAKFVQKSEITEVLNEKK